MTTAFDPYHEWLGIPPQDQPADHYRLLGISTFESKLSVIENAADRQMTHVRSLQSSKHADVCQQLLNEIAAAKICLLDAQRKAEYDQRLRQATDGQNQVDPSARWKDSPPPLPSL